MKCLLPLFAVILCCLQAVPSYAQKKTSEVKEKAPAWYNETFRQIACSRVSCLDPRIDDATEIFVGDTSLHVAVPLTYPPGSGYDTCAVNYDCREINLLAWQERRTPDATYSTLSALVLVKYLNEGGEAQWTLMILRRFAEKGWASWRVSLYNVQKEEWLYATEKFSSVLTNEQIYARLEDWAFPEGGYFGYDPATGMSTWRGIKFYFVNGDVREKTWEAVIGEKPTKFLPKGK